MPLLLVHPGVDLTLELYVSPALEEALALQWERVRKRTVRDTYVKALEYRLQNLLSDCLDWDLKPPTEAQISYATLLGARHGVSVPSEALSYRFHMAMFLEAWARKPAPSPQVGGTPEASVQTSAPMENSLLDDSAPPEPTNPLRKGA
ncbi:MAG: hypothetical protein DCF27_09490 [Lysobacteraceae bacterium]|nr:MAG: hypothetical protein DCF27_09490 [Xanthomonadaceae bacterium]